MAIRSGAKISSTIGSLLSLWLCVGAAWAEVVKAEDYRAYWLWAGVKPQAVLTTAEEIYLLAGEVRGEERPHIISQRSAIPKIKDAKVWIVYRAQTLHWDERVYENVMKQLSDWQQAGNNIVGMQIDFDAGTRNLDRYAEFLATVRTHLPRGCKLSVTGLLDWSANGDPVKLASLADVVDEVVLQIYQGRRVIPGYRNYLAKLDYLPVPFRMGLLQGGEWEAPATFEDNPNFRGYVVFLLNGVP